MAKDRFKLVPFVAIILKKDNKILLLDRIKKGWGYGEYTLPGGGVDGDETIRAAAVREVNEEVGVSVKEEDLSVLHISHRKLSNNFDEALGIFLQVEKWEGELKNMEPDKCVGIEWFDIDNLPENTVIELKIVLEKIAKNQIYSEIGW